MRSELIFKAASHQSNRYMLVRLAARIADTMNSALEHLGHGAPAVATVARKR
jgi:DNA-directed RNA polymerase subunit K/omega